MKGRGFYFETKNRSLYYYDDSNGSVTLEEMGERKCRDDRQKCSGRIPAVNPELSHAIDVGNEDRAVREIKRYLERDGYKQLILIVTEDCNLRCQYCVYSGNYAHTRVHQPLYMPWDVASAAIKWYLASWVRVKEIDPRRIPSIGFYGGEPLLCFDLIKQVVSYARELYSGRIYFHVTTNGTLLCGEVADFLANNGFGPSITINGPQTEHDRMRTFPDGAGSFGLIWENLLKLREKYPRYYKEQCIWRTDFDAGTDLNLTRSFFEEHRQIVPALVTISPIASSFTKWYERYSIDECRKHVASLQACTEAYFSEAITAKQSSPFLSELVASKYRSILMRSRDTSIHHPPFFRYTRTCIPGDKIAVDPHGNFHCCEKMSYHFPVGNIDVGLDMKSIVKMLKMYQEQIFPACVDCSITRLCSVCYALVGGAGKFERDPPDLCEISQRVVKQCFAEVWSGLEAGVEESFIIRSVGDNFRPHDCRR